MQWSLWVTTVGLAVSNARVALPNFYNIAIGIANVAARLAVFADGCDRVGNGRFDGHIADLGRLDLFHVGSNLERDLGFGSVMNSAPRLRQCS
jgi:hypothetical protein